MKKIFLMPLNLKNKTKFLLSQVKKLNLTENFIYITSNFYKVQDFKINFYNYFKDSPLPPTFTLKSLTLKIIEERSNKRVINDIEKLLIILEIIKKENGEIPSYTHEGFAKMILNFIKEFKINSTTFVKLEEIRNTILNFSWKYENNRKNIEFALRIYEKYQEYLYKKNLIDLEDIYNEATGINLNFKNIIFENIVEIPKYQRNFICNLINSAETVIFSYYKPEFFSIDTQQLIINETIDFLKNMTDWEIEEIDGDKYQPEIECFNFTTKEEEIKGIINLIKIEVEKRKINLDDFLITCPNILNYRNYIKRIFSRFNLPVELIPGYSFILEPSISPIFEFFIFPETYKWNILMNILTSPYFSKIDKKGVEEFSKFTRENYEKIGFYKDDFEKLHDENIEIIKKCLDLIKEKMTLSEWREVLKNILEITGWHPSEIEIEIEFKKLLEKLVGLYSLSRKEFINLFTKLLEMVEIEEGKGEGIRVSGVIESLGIEKKICFFCGATEENFPNAPKTEELLLPDRLKKDLGLDYFEKKIARDRSDFYRIKNEHEKIIFTFPSKVEDQLQMKSIFIFDIPTKEELTKEFLIVPKELFRIKIDFEKFKEEYIKNNKLIIGVTDLELLLSCPYRFYLENVKKIKPYRIPEIKEAPDIFGKIIHESFRETFQNEKGKIINPQKIKEYKDKFEFLINKKTDQYLEKKEISNIYRNIVRIRQSEILNTFEKIIENFCGTTLLDFEMNINFEDEKIVKNLILKGRIDILAKINNKLTIIDLKTSTSWYCSYTEKDFFERGNIQIPLYVWIYSKQNKISYKDLQAFVWNFSFIKKGEEDKIIFNYDFSKPKFNYMEKIEGYLKDLTKELLEENFSFPPTKDESECFFCDYKELCVYGE
ncbi:MAG: PD-(D/E)XK nuclease family protein [Candidatus Omnitrophica bacterium]|nr:PD-(D/E)XK nuclease family protein [Candidatus Omnitrophota bacterium]